jgi:cellulose synthase/poly-beta-1,6-N-acetylglucosamine synthase-like glycosyltransferase
MALTLKIIFWLCIGSVAYNYIGYPITLVLLGILTQAKSDLKFFVSRKTRRQSDRSNHQPSIAIIIAAFNEEAVIEARVKNALEINYPSHLVQILIGLDSPTDSTPQILNSVQSPRVQTIHFRTRRGKLAVISDLAQRTNADILVFTDANTSFQPDCVANLVRHFSNPKVGAVSGEEIRTTAAGTDPAAEGLYWRYESALKILESRLRCLHGANGSVYAIRRELFHPQPDLIVEDFQIPLDLRFQGHWIVYDPEATVVEEIAPTFDSQFERRIRLGAGNFQTLFGNPGYLNPFKGLPAFAYVPHRVLRWLAAPLLILAVACTAGLLSDRLYLVLFVAQCVFYGLALFGYWRKKHGKPVGISRFPLYFCSMNVAMLFGFFRYLRGQQGAVWTATPRRAPDVTPTIVEEIDRHGG